ncbi:hypothetical protein FHU38_001803 [Saccharomonospora amisosensis]|uniref:Uncharacterized protein n=1 Tax=Saccharomonospora amisosensis TaxID=1128677 RepID=A0A7X5UPL8_9PSEU|nr:hypothetical protein [Saccharomonospora amisosensis]NIJ11459.1 hypothetical protein [Saccharomonospora amisosensis]
MSGDAAPDPGSMPGEKSDRQLARKWLRQQVSARPAVHGRIEDLHRKARTAAVTARAARKRRSRQDRLRATPVTDLSRKSADANPMYLTRVGVLTAEHILELGAGKLRARAGIDANMATKWVSAAESVKAPRDGDGLPATHPRDWAEEDVNLVRALLVLDSVETLRYAPHTQGLSYASDRAKALLRATGWPRWKLNPAAREGTMRSIAELAEWVASGQAEAHLPQVDSHLARHLGAVEQLGAPEQVARLWEYKREDLLALLDKEVP